MEKNVCVVIFIIKLWILNFAVPILTCYIFNLWKRYSSTDFSIKCRLFSSVCYSLFITLAVKLITQKATETIAKYCLTTVLLLFSKDINNFKWFVPNKTTNYTTILFANSCCCTHFTCLYYAPTANKQTNNK